MKIKKRQLIIIGIIAAVLMIAGIIIWVIRGSDSGTSSDNIVYVDSVENIIGLGSGNGTIARFIGVVEAQETWKVEASTDQSVEEVYVKVGDEVKKGDKLFIYNTDEVQENLTQAEIDLDRLASEIETTKQQIAELKEEKAKAASDEQLELTTSLQEAENEQKKDEYEYKSQQVKIEQYKKTLADAEVASEIDGVVKSINNDSESSTTEEDGSFITIMATGNYQITGTVNEQNINELTADSNVIIYSRKDDSQSWKGSITEIDMENPVTELTNDYGTGDTMLTTSKYSFYIEPESTAGLMLGEHVYIELDHGQNEEKDGLWLDSYYIIEEEGKTYIWAANSRDKMEKREVTLGAYDEELMKYEITGGLTLDDYIAFPDASIKEGLVAEKNIEQVTAADEADENIDEEELSEDAEYIDEGDSGEEEETWDESGDDSSAAGDDMEQETGEADLADDTEDSEMTDEEIGDGSAPVGFE